MVPRWRFRRGRAALLAGLLIASTASLAEGHPFRGEYGPVLDLAKLTRQARAGRPKALLKALGKDPHLAAIGGRLDLSGQLRQAHEGTFSRERFMRRSDAIVRDYVRANESSLAAIYRRSEPQALRQLIARKLDTLAFLLEGPGEKPNARGRLRPKSSEATSALFGRSKAYTLALAPAEGLQPIFGGDTAVQRYGWLIAKRGQKGQAHATARVEVGRAGFLADVALPLGENASGPGKAELLTQPIDKGLGPTRYAGNRFSKRNSGVFTLMQGERDLELSQRLIAGGVPTYRPDGLLALPYWDWHPQMGWRPMAKYGRVPEENLRVSDLKLLSARQRRGVVRSLRAKIAAASGSPIEQISDLDVVRFFAARLGRIAGLFEGGKTFGGERFFHGMLHIANVSLMGEMVDFSESPGFFRSRKAWLGAYAESAYRKPKHRFPGWLQEAKSEEAVFRFVLAHFTVGIEGGLKRDEVAPGSLVNAIYKRARREGLAGKRADSAADVLASARRPLAR